MRYRRLQTLWFVALLVTAIHCLPTEVQADRRRSTTFLAATDDTIWPEWDGVTANPELTDAHPTAGWPRDYGRICVTFTAGPSGEHRVIIDGRTDGDDPRPYLSVVDDGRIRFGIQTVGSIADGEVIPGKVHTACVDRSYGPITSLYLDGRLIGTSTTLPAWDWHPTARLGSRYGDADPLGGEIKSIQWRGLRFACDMRSDTCSDGRKITTVRATPVPCEVAPGQWEMVPEDTACISWRGLEAWAANTSYLSYGAELDRSPWAPLRSGTIEKLSDGYRITSAAGQSQPSGRIQVLLSQETEGPVTLSCVVRTQSPIGRLTLEAGMGVARHIEALDTGGQWETVSVSGTVAAGANRWAGIAPRNTDLTPASVDVKACWYTYTSTPGRACWGGEAPVTCDGDRHTVSTEGWPTEAGEISLVYTPQGVGIGTWMYLAATTAIGEGRPSGFYLYRISASGGLVFGLRRGDTISAQATQDLAWENGRSYHVRVRWSPERAEIWRDGVLLRSWVPTVVPDSQPGTAVIGTHPSGTNPAQGSIRSLTVRSYEEVSQ